MKNIVGVRHFSVTFLLVILCAYSAFAANWIQVMPANDGFELLKNSSRSSEKHTQIGNTLIIQSGEVFNDEAIKKSALNSIMVGPGEKLYLITSKDPVILNANFAGTRLVFKEMGFMVLLAGETAAMNLMSKQSDFTRVELLPENQTLLTAPIICNKAVIKAGDQTEKFLSLLDMKVYLNDLNDLVNFKTRVSYVSQAQNALDHCEKIFKDLGYDTRQASFNIGSNRTANLIAEIKGSDEERYGEIIIGGHLDSISPQPKTNAPGADDNGSGSAGVIAMARMLKASGLKPAATIKFILFMGEEQGLYGSKAYVKELNPEARKKIRGVFTLDMIAYDAVQPLSIMLETASFNRPMAENFQELAKNYASFSIQTSFRPYGSDHAPFINVQIPAMLTIESEFATNPNYHQITDLMDSINPALCENIIRLNAAAMFVYGVIPATD